LIIFRYFARILFLVGLLTGTVSPALAHAIIVQSHPATGSAVPGPDIDIVFRFNVRIDGDRSKLTVMRPDGSTADVALAPDPNPAVLAGRLTGLAPGAYSIRWQVLATDGHITRGDVPFTVAP
jgi:methionine-rich copper-binding protein CopC